MITEQQQEWIDAFTEFLSKEEVAVNTIDEGDSIDFHLYIPKTEPNKKKSDKATFHPKFIISSDDLSDPEKVTDYYVFDTFMDNYVLGWYERKIKGMSTPHARKIYQDGQALFDNGMGEILDKISYFVEEHPFDKGISKEEGRER